MEKRNTKQRILDEALQLFSIHGYESTSVADISQAVGIKAAALYKHYQNKQAIFDAILQELTARYERYAQSMRMNGVHADQDAGRFMELGEELLIHKAMGLFSYFLHDAYTHKFRKMLSMEQYRNPQLAALLTKQYADDPLSFQGAMFHLFTQAGFMIPEDPQIMALHFYAPIYMWLHICDSQPEREQEAMNMLKKHIVQFNRLYRTREE